MDGYQRGEICRSCRCRCSIRRESSLVNGAFVSKEGSDPETCQQKSRICIQFPYQSPVTPSRSIGLLSGPSQLVSCAPPHVHVKPTLARRNHVVFLISNKSRKAEMCDRSRMTMAGQRNILFDSLLRNHDGGR